MGDSVSRQQWLALAASFHRLYELQDAEFPSPVTAHEWPGGHEGFMVGSTRLLGSNGRCDCHRLNNRNFWLRMTENRYYWRDGTLNISFFFVAKPERLAGRWQPGNPDELRNWASKFEPHWVHNWTKTLSRIVSKLQPPPTVLVLNAGQWTGLKRAQASALRRAAEAITPRVLWKTTTKMVDEDGPAVWQDVDRPARRAFGEIFDAAYLTRDLRASSYSDSRHLKASALAMLNSALLRQLFGPEAGERRCAYFTKGRCKLFERLLDGPKT